MDETSWLTPVGFSGRRHPFDGGLLIKNHPAAFFMLTNEGVPYEADGDRLSRIPADFCRAHPAKVAEVMRALIAVGTEDSEESDNGPYNDNMLAELDAQARMGWNCHDDHAT